jgi:hypothetical protein
MLTLFIVIYIRLFKLLQQSPLDCVLFIIIILKDFIVYSSESWAV